MKIINFIVDVLLLGVAFIITDYLMLNVIKSESILLDFILYTVSYVVMLGIYSLAKKIFDLSDK